MATSVNDLKARLRQFLSDPRADKSFHAWFAMLLMDVHQQNNAELESLAFAVQRAFSDAAEGTYTPQELRNLLNDYSFVHQEDVKQVLKAYRVFVQESPDWSSLATPGTNTRSGVSKQSEEPLVVLLAS